MSAGVEVAREGADQGAEVEPASGRGRETTLVWVGGIDGGFVGLAVQNWNRLYVLSLRVSLGMLGLAIATRP